MKVRIRETHEYEADLGEVTEAEFASWTKEEQDEALNDAAIEADRVQGWENVKIERIAQ